MLHAKVNSVLFLVLILSKVLKKYSFSLQKLILLKILDFQNIMSTFKRNPYYTLVNSQTCLSCVREYAESICIPKSVTEIDMYAFFACSKLFSLYIPDSVVTIGDCAFQGCTYLTELSIPRWIHDLSDVFCECCPNMTIYRRYCSDTYMADNSLHVLQYNDISPDIVCINTNAITLFDTALVSVLYLLDLNDVDDAVNIGTQLVSDYLSVCYEEIDNKAIKTSIDFCQCGMW